MACPLYRALVFISLALTISAAGANEHPEYAPVAVRLEGTTDVWTVSTPVYETDQDAIYQTERYGEQFTYVFTGLPPGLARLKLGFCENEFTQSGERVFTISVNGRVIFNHFDILQCGRPGEAVVRTADINIPADQPLRVEFSAHQDNAKVNLLKIYTDEWVVALAAGQEGEDLAPPAALPKDAASNLRLYETALGKFGSRVAINPRPQLGMMHQSPLGHADYRVAYFEQEPEKYQLAAVQHIFALHIGDEYYALPFTDLMPIFTDIEQTQTLTTLTYRGRSPELPVELTLKFSAPFYPQNIKLSTAPYLRLDVTVHNRGLEPVTGEFVVAQGLRNSESVRAVEQDQLVGVAISGPVFGIPTTALWLSPASPALSVFPRHAPIGLEDQLTPPEVGEDADGRAVLPLIWGQRCSGLPWQFSLPAGEQDAATFIYVGWVEEPVLQIKEEPYRFRYLEFFSRPTQVARYALDEWPEIERRSALFESTVSEASIPAALKELLAFAFQSWITNTWWVTSATGEDWFSVWEGCCKLHSTVDVEYNVAPLYLQYWPDLLRMELVQWADYVEDNTLAHDMGMGLTVGAMAYPHHMKVEENTNFVLLLDQYWKQTGDSQLIRQLFPTVKELLAGVTESDTDNDGFAETGTYNTIDQGSAVVQHASDQVYLAIKSLAAYEAGAQMAIALDEVELADWWRARQQLIGQTLNEQGWLGDHYAVALNQTLPAEDEAVLGEDDAGYESEPPAGWDGYSLYTANGAVYPMRSAMSLDSLDIDRLREDLVAATRHTLKLYGAPHTDQERNMWVSQNIWRDMAAAYLGIDMISNVERYWALQKYINTAKHGCFTDVYVYGSDSTSLDYYPRGVAGFGLLYALGGIQTNRVTQTISVSPLRSPLRLALTGFADWDREAIPWLTMTGRGKDTQIGVNHPELLQQMTLHTRPLGQPW